MIFASQHGIISKMSHIMGVFKESEARIRPHFFLTGPSGSGKSFLTKMVTEDLKLHFFEMSAAQITAEGMSGNSLSKALRPLRDHWNEPNVILVDEFDKLFQRNGEKTEDFRSMVQDEFLQMLESKYTSIFTDYGKYEPIRIDNSLIVFAGAFSNQKITTLPQLKEAGLRTEFVGRVPLVFSTEEVSLAELKKAIPHLALFKEYIKLYPETPSSAVKDIAALLTKQMGEANIGIRMLTSVIHQYFMRDL